MSSVKVAPAGDPAPLESGPGSSASGPASLGSDRGAADAVQDLEKPRQEEMLDRKETAPIKRLVKDYPKTASTKDKRAFVKSWFVEHGIKPWQAGLCCGCVTIGICSGLAFLTVGIIFVTRNMSFSGGNTVLRASNGEAVATAETGVKLSLKRLREVAQDPTTTKNQNVLRDLTEVSFNMPNNAGSTHITLRVAEAKTNVVTANPSAGELQLISASGNYVKVPADSTVSPSYCSGGSCSNILINRRLTNGQVGMLMDDGTFVAYEVQQVETEEEKEDEEIKEASMGTKVAGFVLMGCLFLVIIIVAIICPEALQCFLIFFECLAACG